MRRMTIAFLLLFVFILTACTPGAGGGQANSNGHTASVTAAPGQHPLTYREVYNPETDFDNRFGQGYINMAETEDAIYYASQGSAAAYLYYFDKANGESAVLCGKPECLHDVLGQNTDCNGYTNIFGRSLAFSGGRLCYIGSKVFSVDLAFYSMAPDSTGRTLETYLQKNPGLMCYDLHRGMLYGWRDQGKVVNGAPMPSIEIQRYDPQTGEMAVLFEISTQDRLFEPSLFFFGDYIYICYDTEKVDIDTETEESTYISGSLFVGRLNIQTGEYESLFEATQSTGFGSTFRLWVESEDRIWLVPMLSDPFSENIHVYLLSGGELSILHTFDSVGAAYPVEGAAVKICPAESQAEIWGFDGREIFNGELPMELPEELRNDYAVVAVNSVYGDAETLFVAYVLRAQPGSGQTGFSNCLFRYDLTGEQPVSTFIGFMPNMAE